MTSPILQFGTSRFLLAHVDLFVSQAIERGEAIGGIGVVQTTDSPISAARVDALSTGRPYPVHIRGLDDGAEIDEALSCSAVREAFHADAHWPRLCDAISGPVQVIVSNTGDRGFELDARDTADSLTHSRSAPHSFPAKLLVLLRERWLAGNASPLSIYPCELIERNGDTLRDSVCGLASQWGLGGEFVHWLRVHCRWANSLVDRIVPAPLHPVGAIAEPYALWAIERQDGLVLPCCHEAIIVTEGLQRYERLKLFVLNLGHTFLAERWLKGDGAPDATVVQAMRDAGERAELEAVWEEEVAPIFDALGQGAEAARYVARVRDRLLNPFVAHQLADIAQNHAQKKLRRIAPVIDLALHLDLALPQHRLRRALGRLD